MKHIDARFVTSAVRVDQCPEGEWGEVAFVGRSNVGKSSLINKLTNRRHLAKTSQKPGKTRLINFFAINELYHLVDLPGYGFARVSKSELAQWGKMIERYLAEREQLRGIVHLIDIRHPPTKDDREMSQWLRHFGFTYAVVATKADKISRGRHAQSLKVIRQDLQLPKEIPIIPCSAETGQGMDDLWDLITAIISLEPLPTS